VLVVVVVVDSLHYLFNQASFSSSFPGYVFMNGEITPELSNNNLVHPALPTTTTTTTAAAADNNEGSSINVVNLQHQPSGIYHHHHHHHHHHQQQQQQQLQQVSDFNDMNMNGNAASSIEGQMYNEAAGVVNNENSSFDKNQSNSSPVEQATDMEQLKQQLAHQLEYYFSR